MDILREHLTMMVGSGKFNHVMLQSRPVVTLADGLESESLPPKIVAANTLVNFDEQYLTLSNSYT